MQRPVKILVSIFAVLLYSITAGGFTGNYGNSIDHVPVADTAEADIFFSEELPYKNSFALNDGTYTGLGARVVSGPSNQLQVYKAVIQILEVQVACAITGSITLVHYFPFRIRKSDMLFPFHYFFDSIQL